MGEMPQAQDTFGIALQNTTEDERIIRARLHYKVATMINWSEQERTHQVLDAGEVALGDQPTEPKNEWWDIWLSLQMRRAMAFYWEGDPQAMETQVNKIKPHIEVNGTPEQQSFFYGLLGNHGFVLRSLYTLPQTLQYCRTSYSAAQNTGDPDIVADAEFRLGFALLWLDRLDEAETLLRKSQAYADKAGIANSQLLCQTYLTYLYGNVNSLSKQHNWQQSASSSPTR